MSNYTLIYTNSKLKYTLMDPMYGLIWDSLTIKPRYNPKHKEIKIT